MNFVLVPVDSLNSNSISCYEEDKNLASLSALLNGPNQKAKVKWELVFHTQNKGF